jgi:DNA polymerase III delta prime subunit
MGMLLRVVEEDEVQAPVDAHLSDDDFKKVTSILEENSENGDSPSAKRLKNRLRKKGDVKKGDVYAWGIDDEDVYEQVMDGDPMVVAVGSGDDPSDYEIKYVTELEFCLHKDVCEGCGEEISERIGLNGKYVSFSTIPPIAVSEVSDEEVLEHLKSNPYGGYIKDDNLGCDPPVSEALINRLMGWEDEMKKPTVWAIGTGSKGEDEGTGCYWHGEQKETFTECDKAYGGYSEGDKKQEIEERFEKIEIGDIFVAKHGYKDPKIFGFGVAQSESYIQDNGLPNRYEGNQCLVSTTWEIDLCTDEDGVKVGTSKEGHVFNSNGRGSKTASTLSTCDLDKEDKDSWEKYKHLKNEVLGNSNTSEGKFYRLQQKAKHKRALHQKLEEHRMEHSETQEERDLLQDKKQVLFYGPPGTGKTHTAEKIAEEDYDEDRTEFVTFHPSYSYEEFVQGIRPVINSEDGDGDTDSEDDDGELGYKVKDGVFKDLCEDAQDSDKDHLLIIDEVNRGNISSIFGELITLLEEDKRGDSNDGEEATKVSLPYSEHEDDDEEGFWVPDNLHIIGTMNTADRSIAKLDVALRRRFAHAPFEPDMGKVAKEEFEDYSGDNGESETDFLNFLNDLKDKDPVALSALAIREINKRLMEDFDVEAGKKIGHSYMMDMKGEEDDKEDVERSVERAWKYEILPLLNEYFFDQYDKIAELLDDEDEVIVDTDMKRLEEFEDLDWDSDSDDDLKSVLNGLADEPGDSD